jgi:membrane associated rhomboid family serine protease
VSHTHQGSAFDQRGGGFDEACVEDLRGGGAADDGRGVGEVAQRRVGAVRSLSRWGTPLDNAVTESFFSTLVRELLAGRSFATRAEARSAIFEYVEVFCNRQRRHSTLGYLSPVAFEAQALPPRGMSTAAGKLIWDAGCQCPPILHPSSRLPPSLFQMLFPLSDDDRNLDGPAWATIAFIALNVLLFVYQLSDPAFTYGWSVVPEEITSGQDLVNAQPIPEEEPNVQITSAREIPQRPGPGNAPLIYLTMISAMFMHGGWGHIAGNMLYLWIFGDNVEHRFGTARFVLFYLVSGIVATLTQVVLQPKGLVPNLGASGAIAGVLGAYLVLFPRNKVNAVFFFRVAAVPAVAVLGLWIVMQFFNQWGATAATEETGGVAYGAHIGGFLAGMAMALAARTMGAKERPNRLTRAIESDPGNQRLWG